ncbi:DHS-like NAD/FAD-binding domain-containing protein [Kockiozyma suomiensis]|uniref:DHS-like NAD/FAD-binding domain-containing protein n=1 Tax=Kockiozyma suomiensis TaxID=1337062 RepID=UPI003343ADCE
MESKGISPFTLDTTLVDKQPKKRACSRATRTSISRKTFDLKEQCEIKDRPYIKDLYYTLCKSKRLVVVVGAGISVQAGIPDFRSSDGVFNTVKRSFNLKGSGQSMFDSSVYRDAGSTSMFHSMVNTLHSISSTSLATKFHHMLSKISTEKRLLRLYTQNVDCLELSLTGLSTAVPLPPKGPWPKTIQLHGGLKTMVCAKCGWMGPFDPSVFEQTGSSECIECRELDDVRAVVGKRKQGIGRLRPRIVLYNEFNPDGEAIGSVTAADLRSRPDALLVVGTSLKVPGVRRIVKEMAEAVHLTGGQVIWMNEEEPPAIKMLENSFDLVLKGDCQNIPDLIAQYQEHLQDEKSRRPKKRPKSEKNADGLQQLQHITTSSAQFAPKIEANNLSNMFKVTKKAASVPQSPAKPMKIGFNDKDDNSDNSDEHKPVNVYLKTEDR